MINFLFCIDSNYNLQAFTSIYSLLENVSEKINIFVIHKEKNFLNNLSKKILNHKYLNEINCYQFEENNIYFPNIDDNHISEATYYRLFLTNYIPNNLDYIVYLDADIICLNDPIKKIREIIDLTKGSKIIAVKTELKRNNETLKLFNALEMKNDSYFNAGVMLINLSLWNQNKIEEKSQKKMRTMADKLQFWDQDILNSIFDSDYHELKNHMNHIVSLSLNPNTITMSEEKGETLPIFIHYAGSNKPWFFEGILSEDSKYYQQIYRKINSENFHLEVIWKRHLLTSFLNFLKNYNSYKVENKFSLILQVLKKVI